MHFCNQHEMLALVYGIHRYFTINGQISCIYVQYIIEQQSIVQLKSIMNSMNFNKMFSYTVRIRIEEGAKAFKWNETSHILIMQRPNTQFGLSLNIKILENPSRKFCLVSKIYHDVNMYTCFPRLKATCYILSM